MMAAMTLPNKIASYAEIKAVKKAAVSMVPETEVEKRKQVAKAADDLVKVLTRETILVGRAPRRPRVRPDPPDHVARSASCRARTAPRSSPAARPRRS